METRAERTRVTLGRDSVPLPVPAEIAARLIVQRQGRDPVNLAAVRNPPVVLAPSPLLCEPKQVQAGNVVMMSKLAPAHPAKETLDLIGVDLMLAAETVCFFMVDSM